MKWLKHDTDANMDPKLRRVRIKYGMEGYGLYWYCLELIAKDIDQNNLTFELEHDAELISADTGIHYERVQEMMQYMVKQGLFENDNGVITCMKLAVRLDQSMTSNPALRQIISKLHNTPESVVNKNHDSVMTQSCKIRLEENRKEKKEGRFAPPSLEEVTSYCKSRRNNVDPQEFLDHYTANGWMRGKNKVKDWEACVRTWEHKHPKKGSGLEGAL